MSQRLVHALDLATLGDYDAAKAELEPLEDPISGRLLLFIQGLEERNRRDRRARSMLRHEVGNALSIAQSNIEGIVDGVLDASPARLEGIRDAIVGAGHLLAEPPKTELAESPSVQIALAPLNICALIGAHAAATAGMAEAKGIRIVYETCGERKVSCETYYGDAMRVGQILRNVLINAVRYTPPGGTTEVQCNQDGGRLHVRINDSGPGIAPEDRERVFEPGYRGANVSAAGSGLGLAVVRQLTEELGGHVDVRSRPGSGATFWIDLPMVSLKT
ncbi:MAG: sensor histidine kinase [Candidatus Baltobacteraceae bacterium]